jgi:hypothetical protein
MDRRWIDDGSTSDRLIDPDTDFTPAGQTYPAKQQERQDMVGLERRRNPRIRRRLFLWRRKRAIKTCDMAIPSILGF